MGNWRLIPVDFWRARIFVRASCLIGRNFSFSSRRCISQQVSPPSSYRIVSRKWNVHIQERTFYLGIGRVHLENLKGQASAAYQFVQFLMELSKAKPYLPYLSPHFNIKRSSRENFIPTIRNIILENANSIFGKEKKKIILSIQM